MVYAFPNVPRRIQAHFGAIWAHNCPKYQNFQKIKKLTPRILPKLYKNTKKKEIR